MSRWRTQRIGSSDSRPASPFRRSRALLLCLLSLGFLLSLGLETAGVAAEAADGAPALSAEGGVEGEADPGLRADARARLERAIADYEAAQAETDREARIAGFQRAERGFASAIEGGSASAALYTNLGHAALQAGRPGDAVLAYRRALRLDPRASTARQNLAHVRARLPAWVPRPGDVEGAEDLLFAYRRVPAGLRSLSAAGCFALAAFAFVLSGRRRAGAWRGVALLSGAFWLILLASVWLDPGRTGPATAAVLTAEETPARVSDSTLAPLAFPEALPAGVEVERLELRGDFARIRLANGRDVWVRRSSVTPVGG